MADFILKEKPRAFSGDITLPGDKSISHRAVILGSLAHGKTRAKGFLASRDTLATANAFRSMGVEVAVGAGEVEISGKGLFGLEAPRETIDAENSGTTARLLSGVLSAQSFPSTITGDSSLRRRPMSRVTVPLRRMGARISGEGKTLPLRITGSELRGIDYESPVASAQVKSAILLAGLYAAGRTSVTEPERTRDHTERMLRHFGVPVETEGTCVSVSPGAEFSGTEIEIPSDISSAAFFIVAALINPGSEIMVKNVGLNPLRTGALDILREMGADISVENLRERCGEPVGDIIARHCALSGVRIGGESVSRAIDELPVISVAACFAEGETVISDAGELRVKETDRISAMAGELSKLGADIRETQDGMVINGVEELCGARCGSRGDHRVAMSLAVAATRARGETVIEDAGCVSISFPGFLSFFEALGDRK
ncbi:MAG: 3-phosphoshikimate 1-carboxyvinyltransferase [Candidatus Dadabacteria bacterium]|nr:3-phosphoshikimate 1-carboxyvinyltransferase [Candidatus Dadabacteria bacterium]MYA48735.1 3-phosphoshikimate 1-carboxyvinyltransferase [Candidatus Dadabacteria bacterium]MYK49720.1 3-phosphoshikimate 1-carboxyvinyltransferase [Candidatus Dadabacteria bacterium]